MGRILWMYFKKIDGSIFLQPPYLRVSLLSFQYLMIHGGVGGGGINRDEKRSVLPNHQFQTFLIFLLLARKRR